MWFRRRCGRAAAVLALILLVVAGACGGDAPSTSEGSSGAEAPSTPATGPSTSGAPATTSAGPTTTSPPTTDSTTTVAPTTTQAPRPLAGRVVVIDPGHNGANGAHPEEINRPVDAGGFTKACNTTGTSGGDLTESAFNFDVARRLRGLLEDQGATVTLTRPDDQGVGPCIDERGRTARRVGADVLVSIHADGAAPGARGFHVISAPASGAGSDRFAVAVRDAMVAAGFSPSTYAGDAGLVRRSDLGTLNWSTAPAAMVECGNMRDPEDLAVLASEDGRQRIAVALARAIATHLGAPGPPE